MGKVLAQLVIMVNSVTNQHLNCQGMNQDVLMKEDTKEEVVEEAVLNPVTIKLDSIDKCDDLSSSICHA